MEDRSAEFEVIAMAEQVVRSWGPERDARICALVCTGDPHVFPCPMSPPRCGDCIAGNHVMCDDYGCGCCYAHK